MYHPAPPYYGTTTAKLLQQKLSFLLTISAFFRPSDLAHIPFSSYSVCASGGCFTFQVVSPKETSKKRRIIKPFTIHTHQNDTELCPVECFKALQMHPSLAARPEGFHLSVKSHLVS